MLRHPFNWKRISMAAALAYRWDGARTRLFFWTQDGNYNEESLIEFIRDPRRHFRGERVILLWDRLPSHRSRMMIEFGRAAALAGRAASARLRARAEPGRGAVVEPEEPGARQPMREPCADGDHRRPPGSQPGPFAAQPTPRLPSPHRASALTALSCYLGDAGLTPASYASRRSRQHHSSNCSSTRRPETSMASADTRWALTTCQPLCSKRSRISSGVNPACMGASRGGRANP